MRNFLALNATTALLAAGYRMTPSERAKGRFLRAPEGHGGGDAPTIEDAAKQVKEAADKVKTVAETTDRELKQFGKLSEETKEAADKALAAASEAKAALEKAEARIAELEQKAARKGGGDPDEHKSAGAQFTEAEDFKKFQEEIRGSGRKFGFQMQVKEITTAEGGLLVQPDRRGLLERPQRAMTMRGLLNVVETDSNAIEYIRETGFTNNAAMVAESALKPESGLTFEDMTAPVRTLAHWFRASRQILDDAPRLRGMIDTRLRYGLDLVEEAEVLYGDGTGQHLLGIVPQATAFATPAAVQAFLDAQADGGAGPAETSIDRLRIAILQASLAEFPPDGIVMHPLDWGIIELTKTSDGAYLFANPTGRVQPTLWGLPVNATQAITVDKFLVGAFGLGATLYDRMETEILASSEDRDNFVTNRITIRGERRIALTVERPEAFIYGDFGRVA